MPTATLSPELFDRAPPQDLDAERAVLGCVLLKPSIMAELAERLEPSDFYTDRHRQIFVACLELHADGVGADHVTLVDRLRCNGQYVEHETRAYLGEVVSSVGVWLHWPHYAEVVRQMRARRLAIHFASDLLRSAHDDSVDPAEWCGTLLERGQGMREWLARGEPT